MAKVTISRLFEISQYLKTPSGQQLSDALQYLSTFVEVTIRNLKNGLTFGDNFLCELKTVTVQPDVETAILPSSKSPVAHIMIRRVMNDTYYSVQSFGWKYDNAGKLVIKVGFAGSPLATTKISIELVILFG